ncbi:MAG: hypothetical protein JWP95_188, partial [Actinotalea sp.]|nr:hypothetical protein [Actinotalea sp.]
MAVPWFAIWTVLVVATLVGAFVLLRRLYRSGKALVHEVGRAQGVVDELLARADDLAEAAEARAALAPVELRDAEPARERLAAAAAATERRRDARAARHE